MRRSEPTRRGRKEAGCIACALLTILCAGRVSFAEEAAPVTFAGEMRRMRSADHLYRPQRHKSYQYSGFSREGGNPDRYDSLYIEDDWRVIADHKGSGVVTRIFTVHPKHIPPKGRMWRDIRIEVDGEVLFSGLANEFFLREALPFAEPFVVVRYRDFSTDYRDREAEKKTTPSSDRPWVTSYVPIPFNKRFRYMQRDPLYCYVNVKAMDPGTNVESFGDINWDAAAGEIQKTAQVWKTIDLVGPSRSQYERIAKTVKLPPASSSNSTSQRLMQFDGPAVIRGIRVKADEVSDYQDVNLRITWDDQEEAAVRSPLDQGFGSREQRTLAFGQSSDGWRYCYLPMPFRKHAQLELLSRADEDRTFDVEVFVEWDAKLPEDVLYLHSYPNTGLFKSGIDNFEKPDLPLRDFFYHNGYRAFDHQGAGHGVAYMHLFHCQPELDDHIFFDDERTFPDNRWNGTGHEEMFNSSWGHISMTSPMTSGGSQDFKEVNVRLYWNSPLTFRTAMRMNWEWSFKFGIQPPRDARFASVVYWYEGDAQ